MLLPLPGLYPTISSKKELLLFLLLMGFIITLYLPAMPVINNIFIGLIVLTSFILNSLQEKWNLLKQRKAVQWMLLFFLMHAVSFFLSDNTQEAGKILRMRTTLLLFPVSLGLIIIKEEMKAGIIYMFVVITTLVSLFCLATAAVLFSRTGDASLLYNDSLSFPIRMQSIYMAMLINLAVAGLIYLSTGNYIKKPVIIYLCLLTLLPIHFMLASRSAIIILYSGLLLFGGYHIIKRKKILAGMALIAGLLAGVFMMVEFFPKTMNRFRELMYTSYRYDNKAAESHYNMKVTEDQWNGANIRLAIWKCGWELSRQHLASGVQIGDKQDKLQEIYKAKNFDLAYRTRRNMHNTYLDVLSTFGIAGLWVFLAGYIIFPFIDCIKERNYLGIFTIIALAVSMIPEAYLDRSLGGLILAFFITFTIASPRDVAA